MERAFGPDGPAGTDDDLLALLARADPAELPALYLSCGTEDALVGDNRMFVEACGAAGVPITADLRPGAHDWDLWDETIRDVLAWLPLHQPGT
jgi:S-formylglutathione hydrolase FrmB